MANLITKFIKDKNIKITKPEDLVDFPTTVYVRKFNEDSFKSFAESIDKAIRQDQPIIPIVIDSYGGEVYSLLAMIDLISSLDRPVATIAVGKAMSCGSLLFSCGAEGYRYMAPSSTLMIHDVSSYAIGKVEDLKTDAKEADRLNQMVYRMMARNCGKEENYFLNIIHEKGHTDWYLNAEEAKKHNLANHLRLPTFEVTVKADVKFV